MDCKNCGELIEAEDNDDVCKNCGKPISLPEDTAQDEVKAAENEEFKWNIYDFPKSKKTEEAVFVWDPEAAEEEQKSEVPFAQQLFKEIEEDGGRPQLEDIDKFFTFSKKHEQFQELLDKEYERLKLRSQDNYINREQEQEGSLSIEPISASIAATKVIEAAAPAEAKSSIPVETNTSIFAETDFLNSVEEENTATSKTPQTEDTIDQPLQPDKEPVVAVVSTKDEIHTETAKSKSQIEEMAAARASFYTKETLEADKESIEGNDLSEESEENTKTENLEPLDDAGEPAAVVTPAISTIPENNSDTSDGTVKTEKKKSGCIWKAIIIIIAIILALEIIILGISYLAPNSNVAGVIRESQAKAANYIVETAYSIKEAFSGKDTVDSDEPGDQDMVTPSGIEKEEEPKSEEVDEQVPDPKPNADKDALIDSQIFQNVNIKQVKSNPSLAYNPTKDYGRTDINQSKPIENNIWYIDENGKPVYIDASVTGTLISFNSKWIDYINGENRQVFEVLKKDSKAHQNAVNFSKIGKIKETFNLMELGEIRQGTSGYYVWVHEEIQIDETGQTKNEAYNWIYYLEPIDGQMKIVNYYKF